MMRNACERYLQLRLDTNGLASGVKVGGGEGSSGEVAVLAAHGVGGGGTGDDEAGEDGSGAGDGRHFCGCVVGCFGCLSGVGSGCDMNCLRECLGCVFGCGKEEEAGVRNRDGLKKKKKKKTTLTRVAPQRPSSQ